MATPSQAGASHGGSPFRQAAPALGDTYADDRVLRSYLRRVLSPDALDGVADDLGRLGALMGGPMYDLQLRDYASEPTFTPYGAWGERVDRVEVTDVWREAERVAAEEGIVAEAYDGGRGPLDRVVQFAKAYLFIPSTDLYGCPLAMTDGAARALLASGNGALVDRAVPRLTSRDPDRFWTSGQWMTELPGGSDVGRTETVARQGADGTWRLTGRKWFTSAITAQMALALARPEVDGAVRPGSRGLALFFVELRDAEGRLQGITVNRLKDKLGTRKLPTAELTLDGAPAVPVAGLEGGIRAIAPMLNVTRTWNAVTAVALMQRGLALARDYARKREVFGKPLLAQPLHADTLAGLQAEFEAAFHLAFRTAELLGRHEHADGHDDVGGDGVPPSNPDASGAGLAGTDASRLLRLLTPIAKLTTARQGVAVASEVVEAFGGAGYVEDTGIPALLRDMQVLSIWEGTTNVLALDTLRALDDVGGLAPLRAELDRCLGAVTHDALQSAVRHCQDAFGHAARWLGTAFDACPGALQAGARRFALTLGRAMGLALLLRHAQWALDEEGDARPAYAARRFARHGVDLVRDDAPLAEAAALAADDASATLPPTPSQAGASAGAASA